MEAVKASLRARKKIAEIAVASVEPRTTGSSTQWRKQIRTIADEFSDSGEYAGSSERVA